MSTDAVPDESSGGGHDAGGMMRWLLTYADMITLLMAFFIMMYSMSVINQEKFKEAAAGLRREFGPRAEVGTGRGDAILNLPGSSASGAIPLESSVLSVEERLQQYIQENNLDHIVRTHREERGLFISLVSDNLLFHVGEAQLRPPALAILNTIAGLLSSVPNSIVVEGHTCDLPISTPRFPSNWELSAARSCSVVRYLADRHRIPTQRLSAVGYADSRPIAPNGTEEGRVPNRRVDIVILHQRLTTLAGAAREAPE